MNVTVTDKKKSRPFALNFNKRPAERQELPAPPGFASSVAVFHAEERRETDPSLVTKVSVPLSLSVSHSRVSANSGRGKWHWLP